MAFWNQASVEPKRGFRWLLYVSGMPQFIVTKVKKPSFRIGSTPHQFLNYEFKYPGRVTWEDINFTVVDPVDPDSAASLYNILQESGYALPPDYQEALAKTISKKGLVEALGTQIRIVQLDADGNGAAPLEEWTINNPQITNVNFGQLDYTQEGLINIDVTVAYDWATLDITGKKLWQLNRPGGSNFTDDDTTS
tara:strand:+ start:712 stop:1293 length:582 start_codon:yes stop_codon:yes gene_type:complete